MPKFTIPEKLLLEWEQKPKRYASDDFQKWRDEFVDNVSELLIETWWFGSYDRTNIRGRWHCYACNCYGKLGPRECIKHCNTEDHQQRVMLRRLA